MFYPSSCLQLCFVLRLYLQIELSHAKAQSHKGDNYRNLWKVDRGRHVVYNGNGGLPFHIVQA